MPSSLKWITGIVVVVLVIFSVFSFGSREEFEPILEEVPELPKSLEANDINFLENLGKQQSNNMKAKITTNKGIVTAEIFLDQVPKTATNFLKLANDKFYDGVRFHRVIKDFMVQTGDPLSKDVANKDKWGTGDPGYKFEDEFGEGLSNVIGTLSMANSGPNTNGSQFFINTADNTFLDGKHSVFGKVIAGIDIVKDIENVETGPGDVPVEDVVIQKIELLE
jgi:peptidyl-prolyl cis-trans isomerase B (cyclophilin B)